MSTHILCAKIAGGQSMLVLIHPHLAPPSPSLSSLIIHNLSDTKVAVHKISNLYECITNAPVLNQG